MRVSGESKSSGAIGEATNADISGKQLGPIRAKAVKRKRKSEDKGRQEVGKTRKGGSGGGSKVWDGKDEDTPCEVCGRPRGYKHAKYRLIVDGREVTRDACPSEFCLHCVSVPN
jgi:hypothetical protein